MRRLINSSQVLIPLLFAVSSTASEAHSPTNNITVVSDGAVLPTLAGHCVDTAACEEDYGSMYVCNQLNHCQHKSLLGVPGFNYWDLATSASIFILFTFTAAAGTGGGGVLVPLYVGLELFAPKDAVAISQATIFGGAVANMLWNIQQRHPHCDRPLINLELGLIMEPLTMAGTVMGVMLNRILPSWLLLVLLVVILSVTFFRTLENAMKKQASERKKEKLIAQVQESNQLYADNAYDAVTSITEYQQLSNQPDRMRPGDCSLPELMQQDSTLQPQYLAIYVACWFLILFLSVIKGGTDGEESIAGIQCGTPWFWILNLSVLPIMATIQAVVCKYLIARDENKERVGYRFIENDIRWTPYTATMLPLASYFIGGAAGMLGIGGGLFKAPLLNELGIDPLATGATCAFMILFTSSISTAQYIIFDVLQLDYAIWFGFVGFVSSMLGQWVNSKIVARSGGKTSHLIFILAGMVGLSAAFLAVQGAISLSSQGSGTAGLSNLCNVEEVVASS